MVHPSLLSAYEYAAHKAAGDVPHFILGFEKVGYQGQVIPALLAGLTLSYLEIFWRKYIPEVISMIFVPLLSLVQQLSFLTLFLVQLVGGLEALSQVWYWPV